MVTHQASNARQASEPRYLHLFEHAPLCILVIDLPPLDKEVHDAAD